MISRENQTTDNERQTTSNVGASETHTTPLMAIDTIESVETPVAHDAYVRQLASGAEKASKLFDETIIHHETVSQGSQSNKFAQSLDIAMEEISEMEDNSQSITLSSDNPTKEDTQEQKSSLEKGKHPADDGSSTSETTAKESADDAPVSQKQHVEEVRSDDLVTSNDEPCQELPLTTHTSSAHWDSDESPLETLTVCIEKVGVTNNIAKAKTHPFTSSAPKKSLKENETKNPAVKYAEEIELTELNNTIDEREKLFTER